MGRPRKRLQAPSSRVICYTRVSTHEQADSGLGLAAQRAKLQAEADHRGWTDLIWIEDAGVTGKTLDRPGMHRALELLASGQAGVLMAAKLDRLSRSVPDGGNLMKRAKIEGWSIVALDLGVDTTTATGKLMANVMMAMGEWEADTISDRTKAALAAKKAAGFKLGTPEHRQIPPSVRERIVSMRDGGKTYQAICDALMADKIPTARGNSTWYPSTVQAVLDRF